ncbi:MAG: DUF1801 domain-containing protein [Dysgonamonadaceae bacterium]|jgi:uncharacterized protein YdhG (YjbR/CyaY superfamily)|nr:DUF1801 domain-containing protein [Dysgonamonadaceae bacterium]
MRNKGKRKIATVDEYLAQFPSYPQRKMGEIRALIKQVAPKATESIRWDMPAYKLKGKPLVYFAGYKIHIGFYPLPSSIEAFKEELYEYQTGKGSIQFSYYKPIPLDLIRRIVEYRMTEIIR